MVEESLLQCLNRERLKEPIDYLFFLQSSVVPEGIIQAAPLEYVRAVAVDEVREMVTGRRRSVLPPVVKVRAKVINGLRNGT